MRTVAAIPAIGLLAGAAFGLLVPDIPLAVGYLVLLACTVMAWLAWRGWWAIGLACAVGMAFFVGGAMLSVDAWRKAWRPTLRVVFEDIARAQRAEAASEGRRLPEDDEAFVTVSGVLRADAAPVASGVSLSIDVDSIDGGYTGPALRIEEIESVRRPGPVDPASPAGSVSGGILVTVVGSLGASRVEEWRAGRYVRMPVQLRRPSRYLDPGVPNHERALARRGTTLVGTVKSGALVEVAARGHWWDERVGEARSFARQTIATAVGRYSPRSAAIVTAIVIGDRAGLDQDVERRLQEAGTYHVIAISGGNIAILAGLILGVFRFAGLLGRGAAAATIVALVAYASLVGGGASVDRATLMAVVYLASRAFDHRSPPLHALTVVAAVLVATDPLVVTDPAFLLTCGATLAILVTVPVATAWRLPRPTVPVVMMFMMSVAAEAMLFPIGATVFSRVTCAGLGLNFLAIPLMGIAQIAGMALVPAAIVFAPLASAIGWLAHLGAEGLVRSADLVQFAPFVTSRIGPPGWLVVVLYYSAVCAWWMLWRRRATITGASETRGARSTRRGTAALAAGAAVWILAEPQAIVASRGDGRLHVTFIDVGQGDAAVVRFPRGSTLLVDTGGLSASSTFDIGDRIVGPTLRAIGVRRVESVALTHGDPDHVGGASSIVRDFRPREVWEGIPVPRSAPLTALRLQSEASGARWKNVYGGHQVSIDGVVVAAWHPKPADWERQRVRNDDSLVLEVRWKEVSILLTGDIGRSVESALAVAIPPAPLRVLKVPHHGSLTSSTRDFLQALQPDVAVFSVGRSNRFGHPAPDVVQRYRNVGAAIFRTDQDGAVTLETDGTSIHLRTFTGRELSLP
ncbi:MAG: DNA internalization-related competence protein ComEC/Rec2 [Acidobacteria bacterium RIFCSPLOWO2_12_FULL_65_11]|nr:MAG: DNA internalization-related competence protein ComEC/Rec2 [Acidobacteria bacterium RIFCSPLOWO2_12_FULL_65_11]